MMRAMMFLPALLLSVSSVSSQDTGRPLQAQVAYAYVYNNTRHEIRYTVSSAKGAVTGIVPPGKYGRFKFTVDNKPRAMTTFYTANGASLSARFPILGANRAYDAHYTPPQGQGQAVQLKADEDRGKPVTPPANSVVDPD